jgi:hypothetical protein
MIDYSNSRYSYTPMKGHKRGCYVDTYCCITPTMTDLLRFDGTELKNISSIELLEIKINGFDCRVGGLDTLPHLLFLSFTDMPSGFKSRLNNVPSMDIPILVDKNTADIASSLLNIHREYSKPKRIAWYPDGRGKVQQFKLQLKQNNATPPTITSTDSTYTSAFVNIRIHFSETTP